jgi:hypothetical protein
MLRAWFLGAAMVAGGVAAVVACGSDAGSRFGDGSEDGGGTSDGGGTTGFGEGGGFGQGDGAAQVSALAFDPPTATLTLDGVTPQTAKFTLKATFPDGTTGAVTAQSVQFDRPDVASLMAGSPVALTAAGEYAGTGTLQGVYGGHVASAKLTVVVHARSVGPGVDPTAAAALDGAGLAKDPSVMAISYPYDKTVFPLGLASPLVMWTAPNATDVYKIHLEENGYQSDTYAIPTKSGQLRVAQATWDRLTASNTGDAVKATLSRYDVEQDGIRVRERVVDDRAREPARRHLLLDDEQRRSHVAHSPRHRRCTGADQRRNVHGMPRGERRRNDARRRGRERRRDRQRRPARLGLVRSAGRFDPQGAEALRRKRRSQSER